MKKNENVLLTRDYISIGVFSLIYFVIAFVIGGIAQMTPVTFPFMPMIVALFASRFLRSVALDKSLIGEWTLVFRNQTTKDIPVQVTVLGQSIVTSTAQNDVVHSVIIGQTPFSVINIAEKVPHTINFITQRGGKFLTKLNMEVTIEDQWGKTKALCPNDAGIPPDLVANDGIYTADFQDVGVYLIKSKIHNRNGKACTTTLAEWDYFELLKNLEGPSPGT